VTAAILTLVGSFVTGFLGGILGAGGGVFLVPYLIFVVGIRPIAAVGISIFCVLGTTVGATGRSLEEGRVNVPLALSIEPALLVGATLAAYFAQRITDQALLMLFAGLMLALALLFFFGRRTVTPDISVLPERHPLDGVFLDERTGAPVAYRPRRLALVLPLATLAGASSGLFGIGGGALVVPLMTFVARVPMKAATATSAFTMALTGASAAIVHLVHGTVPAALVAASLLGVLPGGRLGARFGRKISDRTLRFTFASFATVIAVITFARAFGETA
jgi:uncharacterized membrane protein YfcA